MSSQVIELEFSYTVGPEHLRLHQPGVYWGSRPNMVTPASCVLWSPTAHGHTSLLCTGGPDTCGHTSPCVPGAPTISLCLQSFSELCDLFPHHLICQVRGCVGQHQPFCEDVRREAAVALPGSGPGPADVLSHGNRPRLAQAGMVCHHWSLVLWKWATSGFSGARDT